MLHLMIDIETLSARPDACPVTVGVAAFNPDAGTVFDTLLVYIDPRNAQHHGSHVDADTVLWWLRQSREAQQALQHPEALPLPQALKRLGGFVNQIRTGNPANKLQVWANDPSFDCTILETAYQRTDLACPWRYFEERSCRTVKMLGERLGFDIARDCPREGTHHSALDDAIYQARWVMRVMALLDPEIAR